MPVRLKKLPAISVLAAVLLPSFVFCSGLRQRILIFIRLQFRSVIFAPLRSLRVIFSLHFVRRAVSVVLVAF